MDFSKLSTEQQLFCNTALSGANVRVEACIGSGKTTAIQALCDLFPKNKLILYLTYNKLLKVDAKSKIKNPNVTVTNYHGFVYPYLARNNIRCSISDSIRLFTENRLSIPRFDILIIDEYQDIELDFSEMLEYVKSTNPNMQIIMVGDMSQKIYDKTTLDVVNWSKNFLGSHVELEFTQCFRLQADLAAKLGRIWGKSIIGVNTNCTVKTMGKSQIIKHLSSQNPEDILCLGSKTGPMIDVLNTLEEKYPDKFNKRTVYASVRNGDANVEPTSTSAIFTTFDSSKGMEKPICVVFDWDEAYWATRCRQPGTNGDILRNIFCVAASRGKQEIIFANCLKHGRKTELLSEETLMTPIEQKQLTDAYVFNMFDFKFVEEIAKAHKMLDMTKIATDGIEIDIDDRDGLIDLSPCISEYQEAVFFNKYNIDSELRYAFAQREMEMPDDMTGIPVEQKMLQLVALNTKQNRYCNQVRLPLVTPMQHNALIDRLSERLTNNECVQAEKVITLHGIEIHGRCDVMRDDSVWQIEFKHALRPEDFLQVAVLMIMFNKRDGMLWNTRNNELYKVNIDDSRRQEFMSQVYRIITKQKSADNLMPNLEKTKPKSRKMPVSNTLKKSNERFMDGDIIKHPTLGTGVVVSVKNAFDRQYLNIKFNNSGMRKIDSAYVKHA